MCERRRARGYAAFRYVGGLCQVWIYTGTFGVQEGDKFEAEINAAGGITLKPDRNFDKASGFRTYIVGALARSRTGMALNRRILSPLRLPIPPRGPEVLKF